MFAHHKLLLFVVLLIYQSIKNKILNSNNGAISNKKYEKYLILINKNIDIDASKNKTAPNNAFFHDTIKIIKRIKVGILCIKKPNNISLKECFPLKESKENIPIKQMNKMLIMRGNKNTVLFFTGCIIKINI
jgi:hypothetical protein